MKKVVLLLALLNARSIIAQTAPEGIWLGYDGEWRHVSSQLIALAEATPSEKFSWRPAPGVRSTSEVYMHIVDANFYLLSVTGPKVPAGWNAIEMPRWTGFTCASSFTLTSTWDSSSPTRV